jgi:hypothetical protein
MGIYHAKETKLIIPEHITERLFIGAWVAEL